MRRIFRQCGSTALQIKSFAIRYHFLFADALLQARQNFCQRKEVKAMRLELSDIIAMVKAGQFDLILQAAQEIEDAPLRSWVLKGIAEAMAEVGQFDRAIQIAQKIEEGSSDYSEALLEIARAMAEAGQFDRAIQVAQKIEDAWARSEALKDIAEAMAEAGQFDRALQIAQKIEDALDRSWALR